MREYILKKPLKNGMFIAVPDEIKELVVDVSPNHWRVQAITLHNSNFLIEILKTIKSTPGSYIPSSGQKHNGRRSSIFKWPEEIQPCKEKALF